ncbi:AI-2E family transporter [Methanolapillus ohkumae]|uniref:AI-2E family transporter n=1 Tax=Methanolapillus ohkumae TaxID=3028298 RepID=A0AA96V6K3_9EURY|nr:hypothetical protein MsAm2_14750 [Methanosarcinaceae archaeon Am2]
MELSVNKKVWQYMFLIFVLLIIAVSFLFYLRVVFISLVIGVLVIIFIERLSKIFNRVTVNYSPSKRKIIAFSLFTITLLSVGAVVVSQASYFSDYFNSFTESLDKLDADYNDTAGEIAENLTNISVGELGEMVPGIENNSNSSKPPPIKVNEINNSTASGNGSNNVSNNGNNTATGSGNVSSPAASNNTTGSNASNNTIGGNASNRTANETTPTIPTFDFAITRQDLIRSILVSGSGILSMTKESVSMLISILFASFLIIPIMTGYYFKRKGKFGDKIIFYTPDQYKDAATQTIKRILKDLDTYVSMKILEVFVVSFLYCVGFYIAGLPHWLISGILMGIFNTAPYIGFIIPALPIIVYSYTFGMPTMLAVIGIIIVIQLFDYFFILPNIVTSTIKVSSFTSVILALAGLKLFGVFGLIFAMPLYIFCKIILISFYEQLVILYPDPTDSEKSDLVSKISPPGDEKLSS